MGRKHRKTTGKTRRTAKRSAHKGTEDPGRTVSQQRASRIVLPACLIVVVCAAVSATYWPALSAKAMYFDDEQYLTENLLVQDPSWSSVRRFFTEVLEPSTVKGYYQPMTMVSLMLDHALGGRTDNLMPFHRTSLALHVANSGLVIVMLYLLFGRIWLAAGVGLLFGLHPMTVEPVPWVGERKTLLAAFFALWCLIFYLRFSRNRDWKLYTGCILMYVMALMAKPTSVPLPVVMLLIDFWPLQRLKPRVILEKVPLFAVGAFFAVITVISQSRAASVILPSEYSKGWIPLTLCHNIVFYPYKMLLPINLSSQYAFPKPFDLSHPAVLAGVIGTGVLIPLLLLSLRWTRAPLTSWLIFFVAIFPTMGVIGFTGVIASDKYAYLPSVGLLMLLMSLFAWLCRASRRSTKVVLATIVLTVACAEAVATRRHLARWRDTEGLFEYMLTLTPYEAPLHINLGNELLSQSRYDEAVSHYQRALQITPGNAVAHHNLANAFKSQRKLDQAASHYREALRIKPDYAKAHFNLGRVLELSDKRDQAIEHYQQALQIEPRYVGAYNSLANALFKAGRLEDAIESYSKAINLRPRDASLHSNLGNILAMSGKLAEAIGHYERSLAIRPGDAKVLSNLGNALLGLGRLPQAEQKYTESLKISSDNAGTYFNLGVCLEKQGRVDEAVRSFKQALAVDPQHKGARDALERHKNAQ